MALENATATINIFRQPSIKINGQTVSDTHAESFIGIEVVSVPKISWYDVAWKHAKELLLKKGRTETVRYFEESHSLQPDSLLRIEMNDVKRIRK